jgi:sugar phosphate permease
MMPSYVDRGLLAVSEPLMQPDLGLTATEFGFGISAFFWIYAPAQLVCGCLVDRLSAPRLFAFGVALQAVAIGLTGAATGLTSLVALRLVLGHGQSFCFPGSSKMIASYCCGESRGSCDGAVRQEWLSDK